ncbi:MAG TPA: glycosyltransferase family 4 protein [Verrucomicrobiaceae bacterium]
MPPVLGGGVEKMWHTLAGEFTRRGHEVTYVSRAFGDFPRMENRDGVRHVRVPGFDTPASLWKLKLLDLVYSRRCARVLEASDIIVTHTFWLPMFRSVCRKGAVYVDVQRMPKGQMRFYGGAARLRANSAAVAHAIQSEAPALAGRVTLIPNPLPFPPMVHPQPAAAERERILLYAGRVHPEKGIHVLLESYRRLPAELRDSWRVRVVGPWREAEGGGGEGYLNRLKSAARDGSVEFCGPVHGEAQLSEHYRSAPIFVYPSLAAKGETFGLAVLEAMAHGCVPVTSNLSCFQDFIEPGLNGIVFDLASPDPPGRLAGALQSLMSDRSQIASLSAKAIEVNQSHASGRIAEMFLEDFARVNLARSKPGVPIA